MINPFPKQAILMTLSLACSGASFSESIFDKALVAKPLIDERELVSLFNRIHLTLIRKATPG